MPTRIHHLAVLVVALLAVGCSDTAPSPDGERLATDLGGVLVEVEQSETCGCCGEWVAHIEAAGAQVAVTYVDDVGAVKEAAGVPAELFSCHTSWVDGYAVEGHVPAEAIADLLEQRPEVDGIALAGMPLGSPGMPGEQEAPFEVRTFTDGFVGEFGDY